MRKSSRVWIPILLVVFATVAASAQSFRVQCPTSTVTHPDLSGSGINSSDPPGPALHGLIKMRTNLGSPRCENTLSFQEEPLLMQIHGKNTFIGELSNSNALAECPVASTSMPRGHIRSSAIHPRQPLPPKSEYP